MPRNEGRASRTRDCAECLSTTPIDGTLPLANRGGCHAKPSGDVGLGIALGEKGEPLQAIGLERGRISMRLSPPTHDGVRSLLP